MDSEYTDKFASGDEQPDVGYLLSEYSRAIGEHGDNVLGNGGDNSIGRYDDVRYARWDGQSDDGKKWSQNLDDGQQAFPWEGASDSRIRLIDRTIKEITAQLSTAWSQSRLRADGVTLDDGGQTAVASNLLQYLVEGKMRHEFAKEAKLGASFAWHYGWTAWHVGWEQRWGKRPVEITMDELMQVAAPVLASDPSNPIGRLPEFIANPALDEQTGQILGQFMPGIKKRDVRKFIKGLREEGKGVYFEEYLCRNVPAVTALKPFEDIAVPPETVELHKARVIYRLERISEVDLRARAIDEEWDEEFVEHAARTAGNQFAAPASANGVIFDQPADNMIEVVHAYSKVLTSDGNTAIYYTVLCPGVQDKHGKHEILDYAHGEYPFIEYRAEQTQRRLIDSRGVPEVAFTDQDEIKAQRDSIRDRTAFTTLPPIKVKKRIGQANKIGPAVQLGVVDQNDYTFMEPPARGIDEALNLMSLVKREHAEYFGIVHPEVPPQLTQLVQQTNIDEFLSAWSRIYKQVFCLAVQYYTEDEMLRISGGTLPNDVNSLQYSYDIVLKFDARNLDNEFLMKKLQAIMSVAVPLDTNGQIDRSRIMQAVMNMIDPAAGSEFIMPLEQASAKLFKQVQDDIGGMMLGNEAMYVENDPAAQTKLQYAQQVLQANPKAQQMLQSDPVFQELTQRYVKNLQMSVQQQQNKTVGRFGVTPINPQPGQ